MNDIESFVKEKSFITLPSCIKLIGKDNNSELYMQEVTSYKKYHSLLEYLSEKYKLNFFYEYIDPEYNLFETNDREREYFKGNYYISYTLLGNLYTENFETAKTYIHLILDENNYKYDNSTDIKDLVEEFNRLATVSKKDTIELLYVKFV